MNILCNKRGETHISTGVKIIIAVVIGAAILGGLYLLFAGENGIMSKLNSEVQGMMGYTQELRFEKVLNESTGTYSLRYSYDGKHWNDAEMPDYGATATVESVISNKAESDPINAVMVRDGTKSYILTSADGGVTWQEKLSFNASAITHFYYGTSSALPNTSGSFSGERFVCRYKSSGSTYYTITSDGVTWRLPTWSDLIPLG